MVLPGEDAAFWNSAPIHRIKNTIDDGRRHLAAHGCGSYLLTYHVAAADGAVGSPSDIQNAPRNGGGIVRRVHASLDGRCGTGGAVVDASEHSGEILVRERNATLLLSDRGLSRS